VSLTASATLTPTPSPSPTITPTPDERLGTLATAAGVFVGAAFVEGSHEPEFRDRLVSEFNSTTAPLYWSSTQPQRDTFDFAAADAALAVAEPPHLRVRGHPLVWGRLALPQYVEQIADPDDMRALMAEHINTVVGRYRGRIRQYDVVNEPLTGLGAPGTTGTGLENYVFLRVLGPGYIREALDLAHAADPDAELFINEFFVERPGPKQDFFYDLVRDLVEAGAPLHGVGFQGHITPPFGPGFLPSREEIAAAVRRFADLGLAVEITELDVSLADPATQLGQQGMTYGDIFAGCFATEGCRGITTWGMSDRFTWIRDFFLREAAPLMFDTDFKPKPAYFAAQDVLRELAEGRRAEWAELRDP
jgi:endo-1,4-beta-xylanase